MVAIIAEYESGDFSQISEWIKNFPKSTKWGAHAMIIKPDGIVDASTTGAATNTDLSNRPQFQYHLDPKPPPTLIGMPPNDGGTGDTRSILLSRRIKLKDEVSAG